MEAILSLPVYWVPILVFLVLGGVSIWFDKGNKGWGSWLVEVIGFAVIWALFVGIIMGWDYIGQYPAILAVPIVFFVLLTPGLLSVPPTSILPKGWTMYPAEGKGYLKDWVLSGQVNWLNVLVHGALFAGVWAGVLVNPATCPLYFDPSVCASL